MYIGGFKQIQKIEKENKMEMDKSPADSTTTLVPSDAATLLSFPGNSSSVPMNVQNLANTQKLVNNLPPQPVGREFVRQFYTMMGKSPKLLYRFYSANSTLTFGNNPVIMGQDKIRKDIEKRELHSCHARIHKIDAQPTLGNGVVVQVIGELSNNLQPLRPFTQTFVLSPHIPKNFYVHNEIFRYQDEFYPDIALSSLKPDLIKQISAPPTANGSNNEIWMPPSEQPLIAKKLTTTTEAQTTTEEFETETKFEIETEAVAVSPEIQEWMNNNNNSLKQADNKFNYNIETEIPETQLIGEPTKHQQSTKKMKHSSIKSPLDSDIQKPLTVITSVTTMVKSNEALSLNTIEQSSSNTGLLVEMRPSKTTSTDNLQTSSNTMLTSSTQNHPMTYANVFKSASGQFKIKPPTEILPDILHSEISTTYIPSATFSPSNSPVLPATSEPLSRKQINSENKHNKQMGGNSYRYNRNEGAARYIGKSNSNNLITSTSYLQQRRTTRQPRERYNDSLQLFLGNLPPSATVDALTPIFARFGTILELRVLSKSVQPGMKKLPNYGFLTYENKESVQKCLDNVPFYFPENSRNGSRLNVRPKNSDESQSSRPLKTNTRSDIPNNEPLKNTGGNFANRMSYKRNEKRIRYGNQQEVDTPTAIEPISMNNANTERRVESKTFTMDDWPQLCSPAGGGGVVNLSSIPQRREQPKPTN